MIQDEAPDAIKAGEIKNQFGRKVAIVCFILRLHLNHECSTANAMDRMRMQWCLERNFLKYRNTNTLQLHEHLLIPDRRTV